MAMADMKGEYHSLPSNGEHSEQAKSGRWLKLGITLLSASCLALLSTSAVQASMDTSIHGNRKFLEGTANWAWKDPATDLVKGVSGSGKKAAGKGKVEEVSPKAKKATKGKTQVDPVQQRIAVVCEALQKEKLHSSANCSDMLIASAPYALGELKEKRHEWYQNVVSMMGDVFNKQQTHLQEKLAEKQAVIDGVNAQQGTLQAQKQSLEDKIQAHQMDLDTKKTTQEANKALLKERDNRLNQLKDEITNANNLFSSLVETKERKHSLKETAWDTSKDQSRNPETVNAILEGIPIPQGLKVAVPFALYQNPATRNSFDNITVMELEKFITTHIANLDQQIQDTKKGVAEKEAELLTSQAAIESAQQQLQLSAEMVANATTAKEGLNAELKELQKSLKQHQPAMKSATADMQQEQSSLDAFQDILNQFAMLKDRTEVPEPAAEAENTAMETTGEAVKAAETQKVEGAEPMQVIKPAEEVTAPAMEEVKPVQEAAGSPMEVVKPAEGAAQSMGNTQPAMETMKPAMQATGAAVESTQPAVQATGFAMENTQPAVKVTGSAMQNEQPAVAASGSAMGNMQPSVGVKITDAGGPAPLQDTVTSMPVPASQINWEPQRMAAR